MGLGFFLKKSYEYTRDVITEITLLIYHIATETIIARGKLAQQTMKELEGHQKDIIFFARHL